MIVRQFPDLGKFAQYSFEISISFSPMLECDDACVRAFEQLLHQVGLYQGLLLLGSRSIQATHFPPKRNRSGRTTYRYLFVSAMLFVPLLAGNVAAFPLRVSVPSALMVKRVTVLGI